jgi:hypothetical protein
VPSYSARHGDVGDQTAGVEVEAETLFARE